MYRAWYRFVVDWARRLGGNSSDCEDLAQEVFVVVRRRMAEFEGDNIPGWLYRITRSRVRDHRRLKWSQTFATCVPPEGLIEDASGPFEKLEVKRRYIALERRWARLNEGERSALTLLELHGYSGEEIAATLGVPLNTVWSRIRRARLKLMNHAVRRSACAPRRRPETTGSDVANVQECA